MDNLIVSRITVDEGPSMWRIRPRAQGRANWIQKRTSHVTVVLAGKVEEAHVGQKVHPYGFRLGTLYGWQSNWFAEKHYGEQLQRGRAYSRSYQE